MILAAAQRAATDPSFLEEIGPTLVAVVLTGIVGVVATWFGRLWERKAGLESWLREQRLAACATFLAATHSAWTPVWDLGTITASGPDHRTPEGERTLVTAKSEAGIAVSRVIETFSLLVVLGPTELEEKGRELNDEVMAQFAAALTGRLEDGGDELIKVREEFGREARRVLTT